MTMTNHTITEALERFTLIDGPGSPEDGEACAMTMLAWIHGDEWTVTPQCASKVLARNVIIANDASSTTPEMRAELVKSGMEGVLGTADVPRLPTPRSTARRAGMTEHRTNLLVWPCTTPGEHCPHDTWRQRAEELEGLLLDMGGYIGSDVFIRASNAHDMNVKCARLTTDLAAAERTVKEQREALEAISEFGCDECGDAGDTCLDRFRLNPSQWCQTCIAIAALAPNTEGEA